MNINAATAVIAVILAVVIVIAAAAAVKKFTKGGGCCGEHEASEKRVRKSHGKKSDYEYTVRLRISGMTCENCAVRLENAYNSLDGVWAKVSFTDKTADIRMKTEPDIQLLMITASKAGYGAEAVDINRNADKII